VAAPIFWRAAELAGNRATSGCFVVLAAGHPGAQHDRPHSAAALTVGVKAAAGFLLSLLVLRSNVADAEFSGPSGAPPRLMGRSFGGPSQMLSALTLGGMRAAAICSGAAIPYTCASPRAPEPYCGAGGGTS